MPSYVVKAEIADTRAKTFKFVRIKTMYGGKRIAAGDEIFLFASETQGGPGLFARGVVTKAKPANPPPQSGGGGPRSGRLREGSGAPGSAHSPRRSEAKPGGGGGPKRAAALTSTHAPRRSTAKPASTGDHPTPRVTIEVRITAHTKRKLGRDQLKAWRGKQDGSPEAELDFKFYRQATNKICGVSDETAAFLRKW